MQKVKNIKLLIGLFYFILLFIFLYFLLSKFSLEEITTYKFIQNYSVEIANLKQANLVLISIIFLIFACIWIFLLGFASPIFLLSGFVFGSFFGVLIASISMSLGATLLYIFANFFLKDFIKKNFLDKFKNLEVKLKKNEFTFFFFYRVIGGIPFQIQNLLPVLFNIKLSNYFIGTFLGLMPQGFIISSLGNGIEKVIKNNSELPSMIELISSPEIYLPIVSLISLIIVTLIIKKIFFKD